MRKVVPIMLLAVMVAGGIYLALVRAHREPGITGPVMSVRFLDESLGNAIVVRTPERGTVVIDPPSGREADALGRMLRDERVREITVIVPNPASGFDGLGGYASGQKASRSIVPQASGQKASQSIGAQASGEKASRSIVVTRLVRPELGSATQDWEKRLAKLGGAPIAENVVARGDVLKLSKTVRIQVLGPDRATAQSALRQAQDDGSLVFRLVYGGKSFLFPTDMRAKGEAELVKSGGELGSSVLVAGRHGQYPSTSLELLSMARPEIVVISAKRGASRPSAAVLERLSPSSTGAALYRTDKDGIIRIDTDGHTIRVSTEGGEP